MTQTKDPSPEKMLVPGNAGTYSALAGVIISILSASLSPILISRLGITQQECDGIIGGLVSVAFVLAGYIAHKRLEIHRANINNDNVDALNAQTETLTTAADARADHISDVSKAVTAAAVETLKPEVKPEHVEAKIEQKVATKAPKKHHKDKP
jgi:adenosylmethionine-8-amino-7-oxononanoate aminotransferase